MQKPDTFPYATVPRLWPGGTVACLASGPSLTQEDVDYCRGKADGVIVVNTTYQMAPWADCLLASDVRWWQWHKKHLSEFPGLRYATSKAIATLKVPGGVQILRKTGATGLEVSPDGVRHGENTGYKAVNVAVHFGAKRIILLGYDMRRHETDAKGQPLPSKQCKEHWHGDHPIPSRSPYKLFRKRFETLVEPLHELGIEVINCTPGSALECFPQANLRDVLKAREEAAA